MADGKWVNVPGKGRRFLTSEGEYRYGDPNAPLAPAASALKNFFGGIFNAQPRFSPEQMRSMTAPGVASPSGNSSILNGIQMGKYGPTDWNPSANPLSAPSAPNLPPADRAYEQEKARVAQMTEQDPMFKKYKIAELTKAYNTASPEEKDKIGLQIWATTNPELAQKLKPGQTGFQEASSVFGTQTYGTGQPGITQTDLTQFAEKVGAPSMEAPTDFGQTYGAQIPGVGLGVNAQQLAYSPEGEMPPEMLDAGVFSTAGLMNKPADLTQMQLKLLKQAFNSRIK